MLITSRGKAQYWYSSLNISRKVACSQLLWVSSQIIILTHTLASSILFYLFFYFSSFFHSYFCVSHVSCCPGFYPALWLRLGSVWTEVPLSGEWGRALGESVCWAEPWCGLGYHTANPWGTRGVRETEVKHEATGTGLLRGIAVH